MLLYSVWRNSVYCGHFLACVRGFVLFASFPNLCRPKYHVFILGALWGTLWRYPESLIYGGPSGSQPQIINHFPLKISHEKWSRINWFRILFVVTVFYFSRFLSFPPVYVVSFYLLSFPICFLQITIFYFWETVWEETTQEFHFWEIIWVSSQTWRVVLEGVPITI